MNKYSLLVLLIFISAFVKAQTNTLDIVEKINRLLHDYSEMCEGHRDAYTVQYNNSNKRLAIIICEKEKLLTFDLEKVNIVYKDENNDLNYSIYFQCKGNKKCITEQSQTSSVSNKLNETKITLIFPKVIRELYQYFLRLQK